MHNTFEKRISLDGEWTLYYAPDSRLKRDGHRDRRDDTLSTPLLSTQDAIAACGYEHVPAQVPGNFELDLYRAGRCPDPFFGTNPLEMQQFECMHQYYIKRFDYDGEFADTILEFAGVDTAAEIFLNGKPILTCENMFIEHRVSVTDTLVIGENELVVHIKPATIYSRRYPVEAMMFAQHYNYASLQLRKAAGGFGWDILPRIVSGGLWRGVSLVEVRENRILEVYGYTQKINRVKDYANLFFSFQTAIEDDFSNRYEIEFTGACGNSSFSVREKLWHVSGKKGVKVFSPKLWMPRGYGEANLYDVSARLWLGEQLIDEVTFRMGIRTVGLERTSVIEPDGTPMGKGDFCFTVNGERIFTMGTNWVPLDAFHSRDKQRLPEVLPMLTDLNCNIVRCWGGNVYEDEALFDFCDENGILIWQDFAMGCGWYPMDAAFADRLRVEIESVVRKYRQHASLLVWAGDNECDIFFQYDPNVNILTRRVIPAVLARLDFTRPYLPSSPYVDERAYQTKLPISEDHRWGPRDYFKSEFYTTQTICRFASEMGYHGCNNPKSLQKFLSPEALNGWRIAEGVDKPDPEWNVHAAGIVAEGGPYAYRIPLMAEQVRTLFGEEPRDLNKFAALSQISQAEAKKFYVEKFRLNPHHTGVIWWNLIDGWPQISDAIVDYYGGKKLAYAYIKRSQAPLALLCDEPQDGKIALCGVSDLTEEACVSWCVKDLSADRILAEDKTVLQPHTVAKLTELPHADGDKRFYLMEWSYKQADKTVHGKNHYMSGMEQVLSANEYIDMIKKAGFDGDAFFL